MSQGLLAVIISVLAAIIAIIAFGKSRALEFMFTKLCEAIQADLEELEMTESEKMKKIEEVIKFTEEAIEHNEPIEYDDKMQVMAHGFDKIREIMRDKE